MRFLLVLCLFAFAELPEATAAPPVLAELVLHNGNLLTQDSVSPRATAIAVLNGRIVAVGSDRWVGRYIGPGTRVIDLHQRTVIPGLIDTAGLPLLPDPSSRGLGDPRHINQTRRQWHHSSDPRMSQESLSNTGVGQALGVRDRPHCSNRNTSGHNETYELGGKSLYDTAPQSPPSIVALNRLGLPVQRSSKVIPAKSSAESKIGRLLGCSGYSTSACVQALPYEDGNPCLDGMISVFSSLGVTGLIRGRFAIDLPMGSWRESSETLRQAAERRVALDVLVDSEGSIQVLRDVIDALAQDHEFRPLRWSVAGRTGEVKEDMQLLAVHGLAYALASYRSVGTSSDQAIASEALVCSDNPIRSALGAGLTVVAGTELRTGEAIWREIQCLVDRRLHAVSPSGANHLITREAALRIFTRNAAWISFSETDRGSLTTGKLADLAVLDQPYLTMPAGRIHTIRSLLTMVEGRVVFEATSLDSE